MNKINNVFPIHEIFKKLKDDQTVSSHNIIERIKEEFKTNEGDDKYNAEYCSWERSGFLIDHLFETYFSKASLIFIAVSCGYIDIAKHLRDLGADINSRDDEGDTPLHILIISTHLNEEERLIKLGAKVNTKNRYGLTPLHYMVMDSKCDENMLLTMLKHGADPWSRPSLVELMRSLSSAEFKNSEGKSIWPSLVQVIKYFRLFWMSPVDMFCLILKESKKAREEGHCFPSCVSYITLDKYRSLPDDQPKYFLKLSDTNNKVKRFVCLPILVLASIGAVILFQTHTLTFNLLNIIAAAAVVILAATAAHYAAYEVLKPSLELARADLENFIAKQPPIEL